MKVLIVVLNFNGEKYISYCLESLSKLKLPSNYTHQVIVIDNNSKDGSVPLIEKNFQFVKVVKSDKNLGYSGGNNLGLEIALKEGYDWVWVVNPDIQVAKDSLLELLKFANEGVGILGSKSYFAKGFEFHKDRYSDKDLGSVIWYAGGVMDWANVESIHIGVNQVDIGQFNMPSETDFVTGASMLLSVPMLKEIGLFDPKYFLYYEENDLCQRAKRKGWRLWYVPTSIVWHANAQATGIGSGLQDYYTTRNKLLFGTRWAPLKSKIALFKLSLKLLLRGRPWQKKGVIDYYLGRFFAGSFSHT